MRALLVALTLTFIALPAMAEEGSTEVVADSVVERTDSAYVEWKKAYGVWLKEFDGWLMYRALHEYQRRHPPTKSQPEQDNFWANFLATMVIGTVMDCAEESKSWNDEEDDAAMSRQFQQMQVELDEIKRELAEQEFEKWFRE